MIVFGIQHYTWQVYIVLFRLVLKSPLPGDQLTSSFTIYTVGSNVRRRIMTEVCGVITE